MISPIPSERFRGFDIVGRAFDTRYQEEDGLYCYTVQLSSSAFLSFYLGCKPGLTLKLLIIVRYNKC